MTLFCSCLAGAADPSVPARRFAPLAPVHVVSPLQLSRFQAKSQDHLDQTAVAYVLSGLKEGFHIGFQPSSVALPLASANMCSALEHPLVIDDYLETEVLCGRVAGPFSAPPLWACMLAVSG